MAGVETGQMFHVFVKGTPRPLPRPRFVNGRVVSIVGTKAKAWRTALEGVIGRELRAAQRAGEWPAKRAGVALSCELTFLMGGLEGQGGGEDVRWSLSRPDVDNLAKMVLDAAQNAGVFVDDCQVAVMMARKIKTAKDQTGVAVTFRVLSDDEAVGGVSDVEGLDDGSGGGDPLSWLT